MKAKITSLTLGLLLIFSACQQEKGSNPKPEGNADPMVIAFGSCSHQDRPQPLWDDVLNTNPDLWIWLGDNIYGDTENMDTMRAKYQRAKRHPGYQQLIADVPVIGIWDDHDYGVNDGGKDYPKKDSSKWLMLEFLEVPENAAVRKRKGTYQAFTYGRDSQQVKVILLDTRYFRDSLTPSAAENRRYEVNETGDMLGEAQWQWLEKELANNEAAVTIIGSSIQVLHEQQGWEKWANLPTARERLFDLIRQHQPQNLVLLSGDRHIGELARMALDGYEQPLYEITSSGMTHTWRRDFGEANKYRIKGKYVRKLNFGLVTIDWSTSPATVSISLHGDEGAEYKSVRLGT